MGQKDAHNVKRTQQGPNVQPLRQRSDVKKFPIMGGFLRRWTAMFIDRFVVGFGAGILALFFAGMIGIFARSTEVFGIAFYVFVVLFSLVVGGVYSGYFYSREGQTLGKKLLKLKVVDVKTLQYITFWKGIFRDTIGKFVSNLLFSLGYLWYFMSEKRQAWHDSIFDTIVVSTDDSGKILMGGPEKYNKEPIKTFLPCGCFTLFILVLVAFIMFIAYEGAMSTSSQWKSNQNYNMDFNTFSN